MLQHEANVQKKRRGAGLLVALVALLLACACIGGAPSAYADDPETSGSESSITVQQSSTEQIGKFRFWVRVGRGGTESPVIGYDTTQKVDFGNDDIPDALKYTEDNSTYYLIPVGYFTSGLKNSGYSFDENDPGTCPFYYAPDAEYSTQNLTRAEYVKVVDDDKVSWYVRVQDTGTTYGTPPRSNIYYRYYASTDTVNDAVTPSGTVINLFDYWVTDQKSPDYYNQSQQNIDDYNSGINANHALKFRCYEGVDKEGASLKGGWNNWTGNSGDVYQGIVAKTLGEDGYPYLALGSAQGTDSSFTEDQLKESLGYLFNPKVENEHRETHKGVGKLLQVDDDGYYYYNSRKNFAEYDKDKNAFTLYDDWGVKTGGSSPNGQFFPFNKYEGVADIASTNEDINHYFGMTLTTRFVQQHGGKVSSKESANPVTFEFAGDDDVWIFIDGVLVADLGGIHDRASVNINFSTGEVVVKGSGADGDENQVHKTTLREAFSEVGKNGNPEEWSDNTFADNTTHTLKFYYLERGNTDSNLYLKYNLVSVPTSEISKVDQYGNAIKGAGLALYPAVKNDDDTYSYVASDGTPVNLSSGDYEVAKDGTITVGKGDSARTITPIYCGTTDEKGKIYLLDDDGLPISLSEIARDAESDKFILREVTVPEGHRMVSDEAHLYLQNNVLFSDNPYESGVWAAARVLVTATDTLYPVDSNKEPISYNDVEGGTSKGTLFAVVLKYTGNGETDLTNQNNWVPVYGNSVEGYQSVDPNKTDGFITAVIEAAKKASEYGEVTFASKTGRMQVELENLPGSATDYYYMLGDGDKGKTQYTIAYYYTEAESLNNATSANTYRVNADAGKVETMSDGKGQTVDYEGFDRQFGAAIEVPNLENRLFVQKMDAQDKLLNGATFALYKVAEGDDGISYVDEDGKSVSLSPDNYTVAGDGTITVDGKTIKPVATANTLAANNKENPSGEDGTATFSGLKAGSYYLREVSAPKGYAVNDAEVMVLVTDEGIYANAGTEDDDVSVARGPGYVVSSMQKFASQGVIDNTLTWVYGQMLVKESDSFADMQAVNDNPQLLTVEKGWQYLKENKSASSTDDSNEALTTYLKYDPGRDGTLFNYTVNTGRYESDSLEPVSQSSTQDRRLYTTVGWSYYQLYQDTVYGKDAAQRNGANYTDLSKYGDIANLFSRSTYVQVVDKRTDGDLSISKTVEPAKGLSAPKDAAFTFNVNLKDAQDEPLEGEYEYVITPASPTDDDSAVESKKIKFNDDGSATLELKAGQIATIEGLPAGTKYTVEEAELPASSGFENVSSFGAKGAKKATGTIFDRDPVTLVSFTNKYVGVPYGGVELEKTLTGRALTESQFTFKVEAQVSGKDETAVLAANAAAKAGFDEGNTTQDVQCGAASDGAWSTTLLGGMTFTHDDIDKAYVYEISEVMPEGATADNNYKVGGYTYDPTKYTVTIKPERDGNGDIVVKTTVNDGKNTVTYPNNEQPTPQVSFANSYSATGTVNIKAAKTLENCKLQDDAFEFVVTDIGGNKVATGKSKADGTIDFSEIEYNTEMLSKAVDNGIATKSPDDGNDVYTFQYTVSENTSLLPESVTAVDSSFNITVAVTDDGKGTLSAAVTYPEGSDGSLAFKNTYEPKAIQIGINGRKAISQGEGLTLSLADVKDKFTFTLKASDESTPMPEGSKDGVKTTKNDEVGNISFGKVSFDAEALSDVEADSNGTRSKVFAYTVTEESYNEDGIKGDTSEQTVRIKVTLTSEGIMSAQFVDTDDDLLLTDSGALFTFTNEYSVDKTTSSPDFAISKQLAGRDWQEGDKFIVALVEQSAVSAADGALTDVKPVAAGEAIEVNDEGVAQVKLSGVTFDKPGEYRYLLYEQGVSNEGIGGVLAGVYYDKARYQVTATVTDNHDGTLSVKWSVANTDGSPLDNNSVVFTNEYSVPTEVDVQLCATKTLEGKALAADDFKFELKDADGQVIGTASNDAEGNVVFEPLKLKKGEYDFAISEIIPGDDENISGMTYDDHEVAVKVSVQDNLKGELVAKVTYSQEGTSVDTAQFVNKYDEPDNPDNPDNPDEPDNPDNPDNPGEPDNPGNPDEPSEPGNPDEPGEPEATGDADTPVDKSKETLLDTGDGLLLPVACLIVVAIASAGLIGVSLFMQRGRKTHRRGK